MDNKTKDKQASQMVTKLLTIFGEDINRSGLTETPDRVVRMYKELLNGYNMDIDKVFKTFDNNNFNDLITVTNIKFYSLCEHHIIPFFGKVHIAYIPNKKILGLSKFARLVEIYSHRLQTQENLTQQITQSIIEKLQPKGLIVHVEAEHLCVNMRGIKKDGFITKTTIKKGVMEKDKNLQEQFFRDIGLKGILK